MRQLNRTKYIILILLVCSFGVSQGQTALYYFVHFKDKKNNPYSLSQPAQFLSQRALNRRSAHNIPIAENDLPVTPAYISGVASTGVKLLNATKWLNGVTIETSDSTVEKRILQFSYVQNVRLIKKVPGKKKAYFKNESFSKNGMGSLFKSGSYNYGYAAFQINQINGTLLHDKGFRGQNMVIAVLDGGFLNVPQQVVFDSLRNENRLAGTRDFVNPGGSVYSASDHGRMVLSCMAADDPGVMIGTAPKASYWLLKTEDVASESVLEEYNWVSGAEFADSVGADIINSSLGYTSFDDTTDSYHYSDLNGKTAIATIGAEIAASKGILVVNSAGNSGATSFPWVGSPADGDSVFTIGAVTESGTRAYFSSRGPTYDGRIKPDVMALGYSATVADSRSGVMYANGTSFSSPIVAGMCACLWQAHPTATNMQIIQAIKSTASLHNNPNNLMGWGIPDFVKADSALSVMTTVHNEMHPLFKVSLYPNPFKNRFTVKLADLSQKGNMEITMYDLLGQKVVERNYSISAGYNTLSIKEIGDLQPGYYIIVLNLNGVKVYTKALKIQE